MEGTQVKEKLVKTKHKNLRNIINIETKFGDGTFPPLWMDDGQIM